MNNKLISSFFSSLIFFTALFLSKVSYSMPGNCAGMQYSSNLIQCMAAAQSSIEVITVVGSRQSNPDFSYIGAGPGYLMTPRGTVPQEVRGGQGGDAERQVCISNADAAKVKCENAYSTLNGLCKATSALIGRGVGWAAGKVIPEKKLLEIAKSAGTFAGVEVDILSGNCSDLNQRAQNYCAAGRAKLVTECK